MAIVDPRKRVLVLSLVGLALFLAWQALTLRSFIASETRPPAWDQAAHLETALEYRQALSRGRWSDLPPVPPLYYMGLMPAYGSSNPAGAALWLNWFYLALLGGALFGLAFYFRPDWSALPCTLIFLCAPAVQELLYAQRPDLSIVALTAAAYWALVRSQDFRDWAWSLAFGVLFAGGMLHHWSFFPYMLPALYLGLKALSHDQSRGQVLACFAAAAVLFCPWYWTHLGDLLPGMFQACGNFSLSAWKGSGLFRHFFELATSLGPPFWLMAVIGVLVPQFHRAGGRGWLMTGWFVFSYLFWSVVPGGQARLLTPASPPLAVAGMGAWPVPMIWVLAAFQFLGAANYPQGWISSFSVPMPFKNMSFFVNDPAVSQDWKLADVLKEAQKRHRPLLYPAASVTVVANHQRFNARNLGWTARRLGLAQVSLRGVDSRFGEFSEFVLLKTGSLGPKGLVAGLSEAAESIGQPGGWFSKGYEEAARWPLPDGSAAVLYQQRDLAAPPVFTRRYDFQHYETSSFIADDLSVELGPFDRDKGVYRTALLTASEAELFGLDLGSIRVELFDLAFVPVSGAGAWQDVRLLRLGEARVSRMRLSEAALRRFLERRISGLKIDRMKLGDEAAATGRLRGLAVSVEAGVKLVPGQLRVDVWRVRLGPWPAPPGLERDLEKSLSFSLTPTAGRPFRVRLSGLTISDDQLTVP